MNAQLLVNYLGAGGTITGVLIVAGKACLDRRRRPRLTLTCPVGDSCLERNQDFVIVRPEKQGIIEYWLRLRVCAAPGKRRATNVQCRVDGVISPPGQGTQQVSNRPLTWSGIGTAPQDIMAGSWLNVDLLVYYIRHPGHERALHVVTGDSFTTGRSKTALGNGRHEIHLHVGGTEFPTTYWRVILEHHAIPETTSDASIRAQAIIVSLTKLHAPPGASSRKRHAAGNLASQPGVAPPVPILTEYRSGGARRIWTKLVPKT